MSTILVTGGLGYIGSHTVVELQNAGFDVVIIDNLSNTSIDVLDKITSITGKVIASKTVSNTNRLEFNLEVAKGIYFIEILTEKQGRAVVRVVKG